MPRVSGHLGLVASGCFKASKGSKIIFFLLCCQNLAKGLSNLEETIYNLLPSLHTHKKIKLFGVVIVDEKECISRQ